jgi:hypothetical protein
MKLPKNATLVKADKQKFEETVLFVPFFAGRREHLKRHAEFMKQLGHNSILFENSSHPKWGVKSVPLSKRGYWGIKHVWSDEFESLLNLVIGPKIVFGFSGPAACAIEAVSKRGIADVRAVICDSGPFFYSRHCNSNRLYFDEGMTNVFKRLFFTSIHQALWSYNHEKSLKESLELLPSDFPVLSIRPVNDQLVPPWAIDAAFREHKHLDLEVLSIEGAEHLKGLKNHPEIYKPAVAEFLRKHSKKI